MDNVIGKLTVFFEEPFWVGVFEHIEKGKLSVAKVTFGAEPKDYEIQEYIEKYYFGLKFSPAVDVVVKEKKKNPKRMQREAKKQTLETGIGTKSQQALKLQQEQSKQEQWLIRCTRDDNGYYFLQNKGIGSRCVHSFVYTLADRGYVRLGTDTALSIAIATDFC